MAGEVILLFSQGRSRCRKESFLFRVGDDDAVVAVSAVGGSLSSYTVSISYLEGVTIKLGRSFCNESTLIKLVAVLAFEIPCGGVSNA